MPMMSMELSLAARRRTSSWRWPSASVGSVFSAILYLPPEACEQTCAACANDPDGSGKMYQLSVGGPLDPPQPAIEPRYQSSGKACEPSLTKRSHDTSGRFSFLGGQATRLQESHTLRSEFVGDVRYGRHLEGDPAAVWRG